MRIRGYVTGAVSRTNAAPFQRAAPGIGDLQGLFNGFADPVRIRLLNLLSAGELCVCDLTTILGLPQSSISRHLAYLRRNGLVEATRAGKFAHYRLSEPRSAIHQSLLACVASCFTQTPVLELERAKAEQRVLDRALNPC